MPVIDRLRVIAEGDTRDLERSLDRAEERLRSFGQRLQRLGTDLTVGLTAPIAGLATAGIRQFTQFEQAMAGVAKTVDATEAEITALGDAFVALSETAPISATTLANIGQLAGQLGIATANIETFSKTIADLSIATDLSAEQAATSLAQLAAITRLPQDQFDNLASSIVALGNTMATTESRIVDMGLRIAGAGRQVGLTESEIVALAAALGSVGIEAEAGGTAIATIFQQIALAAGAGGAELQQFARIAGTSTAEFARLFEQDAVAALLTFVNGLDALNQAGGNAFKALDDIGLTGIRVQRALLGMAGANEDVQRALETSARAWEENNALTKEAERFYKTLRSQLTQVANKLSNVAAEFGAALAPAISDAADQVERLLGFLRDMVAGFAALPRPIRDATIALAALVAVIGPISFIVGKLLIVWAALAAATKSLVVVLGTLRVMASLVPFVTSLASASALLSTGFGAAAAALGGPLGLVAVLGLGAVALAKFGKASRDAEAATKSLDRALGDLAGEQLRSYQAQLQQNLAAVERNIALIERRAEELGGGAGSGVRRFTEEMKTAIAEQQAAAKQLGDEIARVNEEISGRQTIPGVTVEFAGGGGGEGGVLSATVRSVREAFDTFRDLREAIEDTADELRSLGQERALAATVEEAQQLDENIADTIRRAGLLRAAFTEAVDLEFSSTKFVEALKDALTLAGQTAAPKEIPLPVTLQPELAEFDIAAATLRVFELRDRLADLRVEIPMSFGLDQKRLEREADAIVLALQRIEPAGAGLFIDVGGRVESIQQAMTEFIDQLDIAEELQRQLDFAEATQSLDKVKGLQEDLNREMDKARQRATQIAQGLLEAGRPVEEVARLMTFMTAQITAFQAGAKKTDASFRDTVDHVERIAGAVLNAVAAMGLLDAATARTLQGFIDLGAGIARAFAGDIVAGSVQALAGLTAAISGIFGESPEEKRQRENLKAASEALNRLRMNADDLSAALGSFTGSTLEGARVAAERAAAIRGQGFQGGLGKITREQLAVFGLSLEHAQAIARALGFELVLSIEGLEKFAAALREVELEDFFRSSQGQLSLLRASFELFDIEDPIQKLNALRDEFLDLVDLDFGTSPFQLALDKVLEKFGIDITDGLEDALGGIDLTTPEGIRQFEAALQELFLAFKAGTLDVAALGDLTAEQFLELLTQMERLADEALEAADAAAALSNEFRGALNEVTGFASRLNELRFEFEQPDFPFIATDVGVDRDIGGIALGPTRQTNVVVLVVDASESPESAANKVREALGTLEDDTEFRVALKANWPKRIGA